MFGNKCIYKNIYKDKRLTIKIDENNKYYYGKNNNQHEITVYLVDKGLLPEKKNELMCDFLLINNNTNTGTLIELKGANIEHAMKQIISTVNRLDFKATSLQTLNARIVCNAGGKRVTNIPRDTEKRLDNLIKVKWHGTVEKRTNGTMEDIIS